MMQVVNSDGIAAQDRRSHVFSLSTRFILELNNCYFIPKLSKNIISRLSLSDGYSYKFENNSCLNYYKNMFGFTSIVGGLFTMNII